MDDGGITSFSFALKRVEDIGAGERGGMLSGRAVAESFEWESWPRTFLKQSLQQWV